jgi:hypothetical protein
MNLREKHNYVYVLSPLKNLYQEPFSVIYFFFHPLTRAQIRAPFDGEIISLEMESFNTINNMKAKIQNEED